MAVPRPGGSGREGSPGFGPPSYRRNPVRIACVQYDPKLGMVKQNAAKVESMVQHLRPDSIDLLVLPEMALSGYIFPTPTSILPYLEPQRIGPTSLLCRNLAKRLRCHVIAGYPETLGSEDAQDAGTSTSDADRSEQKSRGDEVKKEAEGVGWNSALLVNKDGEVVGNYRKTFRFETDKNWAREGDGFRCFDLGEPLGRVAVGICMDMNPKDFIAPWDAFELANFAREKQADMLVVPMNWLDPPVEPPNVPPPQDPLVPSESNLNYWAARLTPLHDPTPDYGLTDPAPSTSSAVRAGEPSQGKEVIFVGCNRVGTEEGTTFIGTSCVMTVSSEPSRIELVECCNISEDRVMIATVT